MKFLIDTDVLSNIEKLRPTEPAASWFQSLKSDDFLISSMNIFEILLGIEYAYPNAPERALQKKEWIEKLVNNFEASITYPNLASLRIQAKMFANPSMKNFLFPNPASKSSAVKTGADLVLAAEAISKRLAIATFKIEDYREINQLFPLPGLFHPGRQDWIIAPTE